MGQPDQGIAIIHDLLKGRNVKTLDLTVEYAFQLKAYI